LVEKISISLRESRRVERKLNKSMVKLIRDAYNTGQYTNADIANMIGNVVVVGTISKVIRNTVYYDESYLYSNRKYSQIGSRNNNAKLSKAIVDEIRALYRSGKSTQLELSNKYRISLISISRIIRNITWYDDKYDHKEEGK
jgi:hypothetical protein